MRRFSFALCTILLCLMMQACDVPRPFHESGSLSSPVVETRNLRALCIADIPGLPSGLGEAYAKALQAELLDREHLTKYGDTPCTDSDPTLRATTKQIADDAFTLTWHRPQGKDPDTPYQQTLRLPPSPRQWPETVQHWAKWTADGLGYTAPDHRSIRSLYDGLSKQTRDRYGLGKAADTEEAEDRLPLYVTDIEGLRGEGNSILRYALLGYLRRAGYAPQLREISPAAPYAIKGTLTMGKPKPTKDKGVMQNLRIVWTVQDSKGQRIGEIGMDNDLPQAILTKQWRQISDAIAASSVNGIIQILNRAEQARTL